MREVRVEASESEKVKKFAEKHWPIAVAAAGAAGVIGAAIWFTARYLREKKLRDARKNKELEMVEKEVETSKDGTSALLNTGTYLGDISGDDGKKALMDLAASMDDEQAREALTILHEVISLDKRR